MPHNQWAEVKNLLVVRLDNIGDAVLLSPALRSLAQYLPKARITLFASPAAAAVAPLLPWIDEVIVWRTLWQDANSALCFDPERELKMFEELRGRQFDAALIFTSFNQSPHAPAYACYLAGIPLRAAQSREFGGGLCTDWAAPAADHLYQAERNLHLLRAVGVPVLSDRLELHVPDTAARDAALLLAEAGISPTAPYVSIVPGASCDARRYELEHFAAAGALISQSSGVPVVLLGSQREAAAIQEATKSRPTKLPVFAGRTDIAQYAALIKRSALVICNNSSALHFAEAFTVPVLALYSGTDREEQWRPRYSFARLLRRQTACAPCYAFECPYKKQCLDISPAEVAHCALEMLGSAGRARGKSSEALSILGADFDEAA